MLLFTHDQPDIEAKHLINPNGSGDINAKDKFENLVSDVSSVQKAKEIPVKEHRELAAFLKKHPSIVAYFHGNENYNEFYVGRPGQRHRHARVPRGFSHEGQCVQQGREAPFLSGGEH